MQTARRSRMRPVSRAQEYQPTQRELDILARAREAAQTFNNPMFGEMYVASLEDKVYRNDSSLFEFLQQLREPPVDIETFLTSEQFLGATDMTLWPEVRSAIVDICTDWWKGLRGGAYKEALLCGATGTGKTSIAQILTLYTLHILGCMTQPQRYYGLPKTTSIVIPIMAAKPHVTRKVVYMPLRKMIEEMPWFAQHMRFEKLIESECYFEEHNVRLVMGGADADSILGEAVIAAIIDEINFMNVVLKSKKAEVTSGRAGLYDQAQSIYEAVTRRKKGRFTRAGPLIGNIVVSSSTKYKGDFTDKRQDHIKRVDEKNVYVYNKAQYDVVPQDRFCGRKFRLLVGNDILSDTRVLGPDEKVPEGSLVLDVPVEYEDDFKKNPHDSLRDIVGMSTNSISPFIRRRFKLYECIASGEEEGLASFLVKDNVVLGVDDMPQVKPGHYCQNPSRPRYVHIDLSINGDRAGIAMLRFDGMQSVVRDGGLIEQLPRCSVELACSIEPDAQHEIQIAELRMWVKRLRDQYGYPVKVVTYDGYNSRESIQQWRKDGVKTGQVSVDRTSVPYKQLRDAINDNRIRMFENAVVLSEFFELEYDENKDKVDHPVHGSKDVTDAICGAYTTMLERRSSWKTAASDDDKEAKDLRKEYEERYEVDRS